MEVNAITLPIRIVFAPIVALVPSDHHTFVASALLIKTTEDPAVVPSVVVA